MNASKFSRVFTVAVLLVATVGAQAAAPPSTISFVVSNSAVPLGSDQAVINALLSLGHTVVVHDDNDVTFGATAGSNAVLISATIGSGLVGTMFRNDPRPVMVWEAFLYDDMGMSGAQFDVGFGTVTGQTQIDMVDVSTGIGDGLPLGPTAVHANGQIIAWGVPGGSATVIATLVGDNTRASIFTYDAGGVLADNSVAAGKRLGWYRAGNSATAAGAQLFAQAIDWILISDPAPPNIITPPYGQSVVEGGTASFTVLATGYPAPTYQWQKDGVDLPGENGTELEFTANLADEGNYRVVLSNSEGTVTSVAVTLAVVNPRAFSFVVSDSDVPLAGDQAVIDKLVSLGHAVLVHDDNDVTFGATAGSDAVLISATIGSGLVGTMFRNDPRPIMVWESFLYDDMGMTGTQFDVDFGTASGQGHIDLIDVSTSIGDGMSLGPTPVNISPQTISWGVPGGSATVIATLVGDSARASVFVYDEGGLLADSNAVPGKRVGWYQAGNSTLAGERLFEQAIAWMLGLVPASLSAPSIVTQPVSQILIAGSMTDFVVVADGNPSPTYQWQKEGVDLIGETAAMLRFAATPADAGNYRVVVTNIEGSVTSAVATLTVLNVPTFTSSPIITGTEGEAYVYNVTAADPDTAFGDTLAISATTLPAWLTLTDNGNGTAVLAGTPAGTDTGAHGVALRVEDSAGLTETQTFLINVAVVEVNDPPAFISTPVTSIDEGSFYSYGVITTDPDAGDMRTITGVSVPAWLLLDDNGNGTASLRGTPRQAQVGDHAVELRVTDAAGASATQSFTITVANVEFSPEFTSRPNTAVTEGQVYFYPIVAVDPDGDPVTLSGGTVPAWLTFTVNGDGTGEFQGFPSAAEIGSHAVELFAADGTGTVVAMQSFTIVVNAAEDGPVITLNGNQQIVVLQGEAFTDPGATASDPQDGNLTAQIVVNDPVDTRTLGTYTVTYSVQDSAGNAAQAQRTVIVQRRVDGGGGSAGLLELLALLVFVGAAFRPRTRST